MILKIDSFGRVLIPKVIRSALKLELGSEVTVQVDQQTATLILKPLNGSADADMSIADDGLPLFVGGEPYPENFNVVDFNKEGYEDYHQARFGV